MLFKQAYFPNLLLGQTTNVTKVEKKTLDIRDQKKDILLMYDCNRVYHLLTKQVSTKFHLQSIKNLELALQVDPITCDPVHDLTNDDLFKLSDKKEDKMTPDEKAKESNNKLI